MLSDPSGQFFGLDNALIGVIGGAAGAVTGAVGYGVSVVDGSQSFSWRNLGAATAGGATAGFIGAECVDSPAIVVLAECGALAGAAGNAVQYGLGSGPRSWSGLACTVTEGGLGGAVGGVIGGRAFPTTGYLPYKFSNLWNPGKNAQRLYGKSLVGGSVSAGTAVAGDFFGGCGAPVLC